MSRWGAVWSYMLSFRVRTRWGKVLECRQGIMSDGEGSSNYNIGC
jgi:hypothetical protein